MHIRTLGHGPAIALAIVAGLTANSAAASERHWSRQVQGPHGRGFVGSGSFAHEPGYARHQIQRVYAGGRSASWSGATSYGSGAITRERSHTGVAGNTQSRWSTLARSEAGLTRNHGAVTSGGRGYAATGQASRTDDGLVVSRSVTTASGHSASRTRTYPRLGLED